MRRTVPRPVRSRTPASRRAARACQHRRMSESRGSTPVLSEVTRGELVESRHRGSIAIAGAEGELIVALGDVEGPIFPRSAVKAMQALPLVESGAADAFVLN